MVLRIPTGGTSQKPNAVFLGVRHRSSLLGIGIATTDMDEREKSRGERELRTTINKIDAVVTNSSKILPKTSCERCGFVLINSSHSDYMQQTAGKR